MNLESVSTASTLNHIIDQIEIECERSSQIVGDISACPGSSDENRKSTTTRSTAVGPGPKRSTESGTSEVTCRICYDTNPLFPILFPCRCKGTMGAIHLACLERWLEESNRNSCEVCGHVYVVERTPRYRALQSIVIWLCLSQQQHQLFVRSLRVDVLRCIVVTPVTIACSYVCVVAADFYSTNNYDNFPPARWTTYSLLAMMTLLIFSYFVWMYMAIQYHQRVWFYWWQKTSIVRVKLPPAVKTNENNIEKLACRESELVSHVPERIQS